MVETTDKTIIPVTLIEGDGIGPEIMDATLRVLEVLEAPFSWETHIAGEKASDKYGDALPIETIENIRKTRLALKGPLTTPLGKSYRSATVRMREEFKLFANVRPARTILPGGRYEDVDVILVRENTQGFYVGVEHYIQIDDDPRAVAEASGIITRSGCRRVAEFTFKYAIANGRKKVTIVHKANILKCLTGLFLETVREVGQKYKSQLEIEDRIVDNCAMQLVLDPTQFDMILTTNMFGDILSDEIAGLVGGLGMTPGGNIGDDAAVFEAVHGTAPDIAGRGVANPTALLLASAMMLDHVGHHTKAEQLRVAIQQVMKDGKMLTGDIGGRAKTREYAQAVCDQFV